MVMEWINDEGTSWNEEIVRNSPLGFEADLVLQMPLSSRNITDELVWNYDKKGIFTVRTTYHFVRHKLASDDNASSSSVSTTWKRIWQLIIPPKVRVFLWRIVHHAIPSGANIQRRIDSADPSCPRCNEMFETDSHAILFCPKSQELWNYMGIEPDDEWSGINDMGDWIENLLASHNDDWMARMLMIAWSIWNIRNHAKHGNEETSTHATILGSISYLEAFAAANSLNIPTQMTDEVKWQPPTDGIWKINTDGASYDTVGCEMGDVIRNSVGIVCRTACKQCHNHCSPDIIEAKVMEFGLSVAIQQGLSEVIAETDCKALASMMSNKLFPANYFGLIGQDNLCLASKFTSISFSFVCRQGNQVDHVMAHMMPLYYSTRVWIDSGPEEIADIVSSGLISTSFE